MLRLDSFRLQVVVGLILLAVLFTASGQAQVTAGQAQIGQAQGVAPTVDRSVFVAKTPGARKTRQAKKTRRAKKTQTATETSAPTATSTFDGSLTSTPTAFETPTASSTDVIGSVGKTTRQARKTQRARKTRRAKKSRTPTATPTAQPTGNCVPASGRKRVANITAGFGGQLVSPSCRVSVTIPPNAVQNDVNIQLTEGGAPRGRQQVLSIFALNVLTDKGREIAHSEFEADLELVVVYDPNALGAFQERMLDIAYFEEASNEWLPLKAHLDQENHTLTARVNHFTTFGLTSVDDVLSYLPTLKGFQTSLFTGAATASYPIALPAGRGGLKPNLSLAYSSAVADAFDSGTQASYVGVGWSLDTGYIARDTLNRSESGEGYFSLALNGAAFDLVPGSGGTYHTSDEQYFRITTSGGTPGSPDQFTVWTQDGTKYIFGGTTAYRALWWRYPFNSSAAYEQSYMWMLQSVTDRHGNVLNYYYWKEQQEPARPQDYCTTSDSVAHAYDLAMYPDSISYNGGLTEVDFVYASRNDRAVAFPRNNCGRAPYQRSRLNKINIKGVTASGGPLTVLKTFDLGYYDPSPVFAGLPYTTTTTGGALALQSFRIKVGSSQLPAYTLTYDANRLGTVSNGIGGVVRYTYVRPPDLPNVAQPDVYDTTVSNFCNNEGGSPQSCIQWGGTNRQSANMQPTIEKDCGVSYDMQAYSTNGADAYVGYTLYPFQPGGVYFVSARVQGWKNDSNVQVGIASSETGATLARSATQNLSDCGALTDTPPLRVALPDNASALQIRIHTTRKVRVKSVRVWQLAVSPRVVSAQTTEDGLGHSPTVRYDYSGGAVNDAAHSDIVNDRQCQAPFPQSCTDLLDPPSTQFRGFQTVRVGAPKNNNLCCAKVTEYQFAQDDVYKGQATSVTVREDADGNLSTAGGDNFLVTTNTLAATNTVPRNDSLGTQSNFVYVDAQTVKTYDGDNAAPPKTVKTEMDYDEYGNLTAKREFDASNNLYRTTTTTYNKKNVPANGIYVVNLPDVTQIQDAAGAVVSSTDNDWDTTTLNDWRGELLKVTVNENSTSAFTRAEFDYDAYGQRNWSKDAKGNVTTTTYDALYHTYPTQVTVPLLGTTTTTYDYRYGLPKDVTDVNGGVTSFGYDAFGRKTSVWSALDQGTDPTQRLTYALNSAAPSVIRIETRNDAGGANSVYTNDWTLVDGLGRVVQTQKPSEASNQMIVTSRDYNSRGLLEMVSVPLRVTGIVPGTYQTPDWAPLAETKYAYDALDRQTRLTTPDNLVTYTAYDHWTTTITNTNGIATKYRTDAFGRTNRVTESESGVSYHTAYGYDVLDRLTQVTDSASNITTMSYDWLGRKTAMSDPDMGDWSYRYDKNDNLIEQTDAKAQRACFYYDGLNRLKGKNYQTNATPCPGVDPNSYAVAFGYDQGAAQKGFRTGMSDTSGTTTWEYDLLGRVKKEFKSITGAPASYTTQYGYNQLGQVISMRYPDNELVATNYNLQRLPESMTTYVSSAAYEASDQMKQVTFGNGIATNYSYNSLTQRLETLKAGPTNNIQNFAYTYDNVGNVKTINDLLRGQVATYNYDDLNRLESASIPSVYSHSWTYNPIGNMLTRNDNNGNVTYQYNDANHKHAVSQIGSAYYCYDANGNMTKRASTNATCTTGGDTLVYDQENKLTSNTVGGTTTTYAYDGDGKRVKKVVGSTTTYYVGNHYEVTNNVVTKYYYFGKQRVAMKVGSTVTYLHGDHLGSTSLTTNTSGACTSAQWYYAYGNVRTPAPTTPCSGTLPTDYTFTGQKRDASAGLMYYNARYYDTTLGRFVSADTIVPSAGDPQALNRYSYTRNNPLKYTDPSGHCWGAASGARSLPSYDVTCGNLDMALTIVQHPNANAVEKAGAGLYIATEGTAHVALAVGGSVLAWQALAPAAAAGGTGTAVAQHACKDGDCTNEVSAAGNAAGNVASNATAAAQQIVNYPTQPVLGLPQKVIEQLARASTQNPDSRAVGLGFFRGGQGYTAFAKRWGLSYLDMPPNLYASGKFDLLKGDFWLVNQQFLQNAISKGKIFILETPYGEALKYPQSNLYWEIDYLLRHGYVHVTVNGVDKLIPQ